MIVYINAISLFHNIITILLIIYLLQIDSADDALSSSPLKEDKSSPQDDHRIDNISLDRQSSK